MTLTNQQRDEVVDVLRGIGGFHELYEVAAVFTGYRRSPSDQAEEVRVEILVSCEEPYRWTAHAVRSSDGDLDVSNPDSTPANAVAGLHWSSPR